MPTFIVAGFHRDLGPNLREGLQVHRDRLRGWDFDLIPGTGRRGSLLEKRHALAICKRSSELDGAPIFGVSESSSRGDFANEVGHYFRLRWLQADAFNSVARKQYERLLVQVEAALVEETFWRDHVRPSSFASPLMLPEQFRTRNELSDMWRLAMSYNNVGHLRSAVEKISRFDREYRRKVDGSRGTPWVDGASWVWDDGGARHGNAIFPADWKYSFRVPDGHHFDVSPPRGSGARYKDSRGVSHPLGRHTYWNVTVHGHLRGA